MPNPIKAIMDIRRQELSVSLLMFSYFFLVITSFWILKPIKKTLFITFYKHAGFDFLSWHLTASQAELLAKVLNMLVAFIAVTVFTLLARRFRRQELTFVFSGFFMVCYVIYGGLVNVPSDLTVWTFYLFGDLFNTLMVVTFFSFLNDSVTPDKAKRLYGLIGAGGVIGGAFGSLIVSIWIKQVSIATWLWITFGITAAIIVVAMSAGKLVAKNPHKTEKRPEGFTSHRPAGGPAIEGARLVFRSRYLLAIVAIVGLYEIISTVMDFQFTATVEHFVSKEKLGQHFSTIYAITNLSAMFVQLFLTSLVMSRLGVKIALLVLPTAIILGSAGFLALPILWVGSFLNTADNAFNYSINQSAKEALYVPTTRDEKYKAKAFIDMFVMRFAKALAVGISLAITIAFAEFSSVRWLSVFTLVVVVVWLFAVRYAGRRFDDMSS
ncbi:MAG: MFS transporter [candidate division Zixibacteria bacterium]|nr:MFS transporter [candidate division Zixibacteria bacterium]